VALKIVCWPRILEVAAEGRLLAEDLGAAGHLLAEDLGGWR